MTATQLSEQLVADVVAMHPITAEVFVKHRMDCVGCAFARFETVREAAVAQGLDPELVTVSLADAIKRTRRKT